MTTRTIPFEYSLFWHAMIALIGREPDDAHRHGLNGIYTFQYESKDTLDAKNLADHAEILKEWLNLFEIMPLNSRCEFGRLLHPLPGQEGKDYLEIRIVCPVEKRSAE
jgi:hypothetical protein